MDSLVMFEEILDSFVKSDKTNHYFISEKVIICLNNISNEINDELKSKGLSLIPTCSKEFLSKIKENFVYEISNQKIAEKFFEAVTYKAPKKTFEELIIDFDMSTQWEDYKNNIFKNAMINWLTQNNITLINQNLIPEIVIFEADTKTIPDEMLALTPKICNNCKNTENLKPKYYKINISIDNILMEKKLKELLLNLNIEYFNYLGELKKDLISTCICDKCKKSDIEWDFR